MVYPFLEAKWCRVVRQDDCPSELPPPFRGTTVALLADVHHGPFVPLAYVRHVVAMTNALKPDIVALVGDFVHRHDAYIAPAIDELGKLKGHWGGSRCVVTTITGITMVCGVSDRCHVPHWPKQSSPI